MVGFRIRPSIEIDANYRESKKEIFTGFFGALISFVAFLFGLGILWTGMKGKSIGYVIFGLCFSPILAAQIVMFIRLIVSDINNISNRNRWIKDSSPLKTNIIDRNMEHNDYAEYEDEEWICEFTLRFPTNSVSEIEDQLVRVSVSKRIYDRYKSQDAAHVFCSSTDMYMFILDGE